MKPRLLRELTLYRFRYVFGYAVFVVILLSTMLVLIGKAPEGLTQAEMDSAVASMQLNPRDITPLNVVDVPYHALQKISISVLGLTPFAVKLPSILIAMLSGICLVFMLRKWFRDNVAVVSGLLAVTSVPFLTVGRTGTAVVMTFFWTSLLLLAASRALHGSKVTNLWKIIGLLSGLALLYSPLGIYPLIALIISGLLHPHVRHMFKTTRPLVYVLLVLLGLGSITPLAYAIFLHPDVALKLLGVDTAQLSFSTLSANALYLLKLFVSPFGNGMLGGIITPLFGIPTLALIILGFLKTLKERHSARSYMIFIWLGFLLPILLINTDLPYVIFIPLVLLLGIGTETLIREWYDIFPFNPYARIGALLPLAILLGSIMATNLFRYFNGTIYSPSSDAPRAQLSVIRQTLERDDVNKSKYLLLVNDNVPFYDLLRRDYKNLEVSQSGSILPKGTTIALYGTAVSPDTPYRIVTSSRSDDSSRILTLYTKW